MNALRCRTSLRRELLDPLRPGGTGRYRRAVHDVASDETLDLTLAVLPPDAVLVLDGLFLHRDELVDYWDLSVWLDVPFSVTAVRMAARNGSAADPGDPSMVRYVEAQRRYFALCSPSRRADIVIDNSDWDDPRFAPVT